VAFVVDDEHLNPEVRSNARRTRSASFTEWRGTTMANRAPVQSSRIRRNS
jgi:hypothetical protein